MAQGICSQFYGTQVRTLLQSPPCSPIHTLESWHWCLAPDLLLIENSSPPEMSRNYGGLLSQTTAAFAPLSILVSVSTTLLSVPFLLCQQKEHCIQFRAFAFMFMREGGLQCCFLMISMLCFLSRLCLPRNMSQSVLFLLCNLPKLG